MPLARPTSPPLRHPLRTVSGWRVAWGGWVLALATGLAGCGAGQGDDAAPGPWVKTVAIAPAAGGHLQLSGTVRAQHESPIAFQIGGRVLSRHVEAGQTIQAGDLLLALDPRDVLASAHAAQAQRGVAQAAVATAERELERQQQLVAQGFVSPQSLDRLELALRNTLSQLDAARATDTQARNARSYTELRAPTAGVMLDVTVEAGQVVASGQTLAVLAQAGARDIEVFLPEPLAPTQGQAHGAHRAVMPLQLRELAGAADPASRSWRARYALPTEATSWALGSVVRVTLDPLATDSPALAFHATGAQQVPLAAIDERAGSPRVWHVVDGTAQPIDVHVLRLSATHATVHSPLAVGQRVVGLGTHLLTPGMAVQELAP